MTRVTMLTRVISSRRFWFNTIGAASILYGLAILFYVPTLPEVGLRTAFSTSVKGKPQILALGAEGIEPKSGDRIVRIGPYPITDWKDVLQAPAKLVEWPGESGDFFEVPISGNDDRPAVPLSYSELLGLQKEASSEHLRHAIRVVFERTEDGQAHTFDAWCVVGHLPLREMLPSVLWFFLKGLLFLVGALVFWQRPQDPAAARFYMLCVFTLGAYMGGYHWSHIATHPVLILVFMVCAVLLPAVSLHFYLTFPCPKPWLDRWPRLMLVAIYGLPGLALAAMMAVYVYVKWLAPLHEIAAGLDVLRHLIQVDFGISAALYLACILAMIHGLWTAASVTERNQLKCIVVGLVLALVPIGYSLYLVFRRPDAFAEGYATWPMFLASVIITAAFALSITRYRLMEIDKIISSSMGYFLISFVAGLLYYGLLFLGTLMFNQAFSSPNIMSALTASTTALVLLLALNMARNRFKKALDRRLSRNKSQIDETLQQMSEAVSQLVDPPVLAQNLLRATSELMGARSGAVFLRQGEPASFRLAAVIGTPPPLEDLSPSFPLIEALQGGGALASAWRGAGQGPSLAQRQLLFLGGEIAQPLVHNGRLLALLILGPKDTPYRAEDCHVLASFARVAVLALESAAGHRTIEELNHDLQAKVDKIAEQQRRILALQTQLHSQTAPPPPIAEAPAVPEPAGPVPGGIVGSSPVVRQLHDLVRKVAATDAVVLIRGESGTGKELLARAVHETSARAGKPYVKVHCAALSANLLESELFGHVKGAFTGAHRDKVGRFELANGGTLFLDEIGDVSLEVQTKLLRVLQERTFERVGSSESISVDVRIVAATHQDLEKLIRTGRFREDLFYRLNVFPIRMPPLREHIEDIAELVLHFVKQSAQRCHKEIRTIDDEALAVLKAYPWPGNVRQLENVIERAVVIAERDVLGVEELPADVLRTERTVVAVAEFDAAGLVEEGPPRGSWKNERDRIEREQLLRALKTAEGNKSEAARALGIARSTLVSRLKKLGLS